MRILWESVKIPWNCQDLSIETFIFSFYASGSRTQTRPPVQSAWPEKNFVAEWTCKSRFTATTWRLNLELEKNYNSRRHDWKKSHLVQKSENFGSFRVVQQLTLSQCPRWHLSAEQQCQPQGGVADKWLAWQEWLRSEETICFRLGICLLSCLLFILFPFSVFNVFILLRFNGIDCHYCLNPPLVFLRLFFICIQHHATQVRHHGAVHTEQDFVLMPESKRRVFSMCKHVFPFAVFHTSRTDVLRPFGARTPTAPTSGGPWCASVDSTGFPAKHSRMKGKPFDANDSNDIMHNYMTYHHILYLNMSNMIS